MMISFATPVLYKLFVDEVIIQRNIIVMTQVIIGYFLLFAISTGLSYLRLYANNKLINISLYKIRNEIFNSYLALPFLEYEKRNTGDLKLRIDEDCETLTDFGEKQTIQYVIAIITTIVAAILMMLIEWRLALFSILAIPLTFYLDHKISLREKKLHNVNRINSENWNSWLQKSLQGWREIKALNLQRHETRIFVSYAHNAAEFFGRWINFWVLRILIIPKIKDEFLMKFALYFIGGLLVMKDFLAIGELLVFSVYYELLSTNIRTVSATDAELQSNMPIYDRVLAELFKSTKQPNLQFVDYKPGDIEMRNVSFSYGENLPLVIDNVNFTVKRGERVAIVGKSGAGKTTLLKLLVGILKPISGEVLYSDKNINSLNPKILYTKLGFVMQENLLLNLSIRENLLLSNSTASDEMLEKACRKACIYDFIHSLPDGYETLIGENGVKLSGGQRQRLILARLFLRQVDTIIFDEATSALDQYSESIIHDAIHAMDRDKTIIVVAHRESSISLCDRVIYIN